MNGIVVVVRTLRSFNMGNNMTATIRGGGVIVVERQRKAVKIW
jgi:hypothetical protein